MKRLAIIWMCVFMVSCTKDHSKLYGTWEVVSKYYEGKYKIIEVNDSIQGKVLYYNDNTTVIREGVGKEYYVFKNLKKSNNTYVDAISGATNTNDSKPIIELNLKHDDTLVATRYISNKPLEEIWVRVKE